MKSIKFGLDFIDPYLADFGDQGLYVFYEQDSSIRFSFYYHLLNHHLGFQNSCLLISSMTLTRENEQFRKNLHGLSKYPTLTILEIPDYLQQMLNHTKDLNRVLNDLKIYTDNLKPIVVIIENPELLLSENNENINKSLITDLIDFTGQLGASVIIDVSNLNTLERMICENIASGIFTFTAGKNNGIYQLNIRKGKSLSIGINFNFTHDAEYRISTLLFRNSFFFAVNECKQVILTPEFKLYESVFQSLFGNDVSLLYYQNIDEVFSYQLSNKYGIIFISAFTSKTNIWGEIPRIRKYYPFFKIALYGSNSTPVSQKVRAIHMGADRFLSDPVTNETLVEFFKEMFQHEESDFIKFSQHKILYAADNILQGYSSLTVQNSSLFRFIKEYAYHTLNSGNTLQFVKVNIFKDISDSIDQLISINEHIILVSTYYIDEKPTLLLLYNNINFSDSNLSRNQLENFLSKLYSTGLDIIISSSSQSFENSMKKNIDLQSLEKNIFPKNYPLDDTDLNHILEWIYLHE